MAFRGKTTPSLRCGRLCLLQDMVVSIMPGGPSGSAWRRPRKVVALGMRLSIFAVSALTAFLVSTLASGVFHLNTVRQTPTCVCDNTSLDSFRLSPCSVFEGSVGADTLFRLASCFYNTHL